MPTGKQVAVPRHPSSLSYLLPSVPFGHHHNHHPNHQLVHSAVVPLVMPMPMHHSAREPRHSPFKPHSFRLIGNSNEAQQFLSRGGQVIVRMRGLPYDCTSQQVVSTLQHPFLFSPHSRFRFSSNAYSYSYSYSSPSSLSLSFCLLLDWLLRQRWEQLVQRYAWRRGCSIRT